ncbi:MAG: sugar phosphate nucleotidyltransferase [Actinomycetales bacterium]
MKAVVMAGGEGTRLRPMTSSMPKPLLPVVNRPIMEHVLRLLRRHGITETVVTVQFLASLIRNYFGDGSDLGMTLHYATEQTPLGTAGSVKNAENILRDEPFLVISGDALTDIDLTALIDFHKAKGGLVTVCLKRVEDPVEFGITIVDDDGVVQRFLEKPTWGQVFSDTVNTGIYVMQPEVLDHVAAGEVVDWSGDVFPALMAAGHDIYGYVAEGYWEDVGTHESYLRAQADVLERRVDVDIDGFELQSGVWVGEGAEIDHGAKLQGPAYIGDYAKVEAGVEVGEHTVIGSNVVVREGASLQHAVVHDNVYVGPRASLRACVVGRGTDVMRAARIEDGAVIGDDCVLEEEVIVQPGVKVYPSKVLDAGAVVSTSVIFESRGHGTLFGPRGVSGIVNVEVTPELVVRLASAWATTLRKGSTVVAARDGSRAARALKRAISSALTSSAINVRDLEAVPAPVGRFAASLSTAGGVLVRTSPGESDSVDITFIDERGADMSHAAQRKLERIYSRQEYRRAFPGEIGDLDYPPRMMERYVKAVVHAVDLDGVADSGMKIVVDTGNGTAGLVLPALLGRLPVDVHIVNNGLDDATPTETREQRRAALARLGDLVASSGAAFGVRFDPVGERISLVDEKGRPVDDSRAALVVMDLVAAERHNGRIALPVTTSRVAEQVAAFHGARIAWTRTSPDALAAACTETGTLIGADGRGGYIVPEVHPVIDGIAAFVRLVGLVARTRLTLSAIDARIPQAALQQISVPTPWAAKGMVMRTVVEAAGDRELDTTDGVRVVERDGSWVLVLPDPSEPVTHLWAESGDTEAAAALLGQWQEVVADVSA